MKRLLKWRFGRFIVVGIVSAAVDLAVLWVLDSFKIPYTISVTAGFLSGLVVNYLLHAGFTFEVKNRSAAQLSRFLFVVLLNYLLTILIVVLLHRAFAVEVVMAKIVSLPFVALNGYILSRFWVFRPEE